MQRLFVKSGRYCTLMSCLGDIITLVSRGEIIYHQCHHREIMYVALVPLGAENLALVSFRKDTVALVLPW